MNFVTCYFSDFMAIHYCAVRTSGELHLRQLSWVADNTRLATYATSLVCVYILIDIIN
jgi:hypothetical protein